MPEPCISVVMSVFNGAVHLAPTLDSILAQDDSDLELVVVDDGSTDGSGEILERFSIRDARIRVIRQENQGLTRALIAGCLAARGGYIARHDAGDLANPTRLGLQRKQLDALPEVTFVSCWTTFVGPENEFLFTTCGAPEAARPLAILDSTPPHAVAAGPTSHPSVMFRRDAYLAVGGYRPEFRFGQDWDLWFRLAAAGKFLIVQQALYAARVSPDSVSSAAAAAQKALGRLSHAAMVARLRGGDETPFLKRASLIGRSTRTTRRSRARGLYFVGEALRRNKDNRARRYLHESIRTYPWSARAWFRLVQALRVKEEQP
jgi:glycosyltransferase involved in cell wall biosynthesis